MYKHWDKIDIENLIYAKAQQLHLSIRFHNGQLQIDTSNRYMRRLVAIYNFFFEKENRIFLKEEKTHTQHQYIDFSFSYLREEKTYPLAASFYLQRSNL